MSKAISRRFVRSLDLAECPPLPEAPSLIRGSSPFTTFMLVGDGNSGANVLPIPSEGAPTLPPDGQAEGYVCNGSLVSFVSNLTGQQKQDILDSSLLAQLAASKKYDREKDTENWYKFYTKVMENVGWVIQGFRFNKHDSKQSDFKLSQLTLEILSGLV